jgi:hypothetical protein
MHRQGVVFTSPATGRPPPPSPGHDGAGTRPTSARPAAARPSSQPGPSRHHARRRAGRRRPGCLTPRTRGDAGVVGLGRPPRSPLLEEERHVSGLTLVTQRPSPVRMHRPRPRTGLAPGDHPTKAAVEPRPEVQRTEQRLAAGEAHHRGRLGQQRQPHSRPSREWKVVQRTSVHSIAVPVLTAHHRQRP